MSRSVPLGHSARFVCMDVGCRTCSNELGSSSSEQDTGICTACYWQLCDDCEDLHRAIDRSNWEHQQELASHYASA